MINTRLIIPLLSILVMGCSNVAKQPELVGFTGAMSKEQARLTKSIMGFDLLQKMKIGPWECYAPNENVDAMLFCTYDGRVVVNIDNSDAFRVAIPKSNKYTAYAVLTDKDKDGTFESIEYDGTSDDGEIIKVVFDENMDGELDRYLDFKQPRLMLNIDGSWYEAKGSRKDNNSEVIYHVNINGQVKRIFWNEFPYKLVDKENESNNAN